jgi:hypothetical protein
VGKITVVNCRSIALFGSPDKANSRRFPDPAGGKLVRPMDLVFIVVVIAAAFAAGFLFYSQRRRVTNVRSLAAKLGFTYIGSALPRSLSLAGTHLQWCSSVWNVIDGEPHGIRVIAFDCQIGRGKGSWRRTVIAVQSALKDNPVRFNPEMTAEYSDGWTFFYQPKAFSFIPSGLMPIAELESYLTSISGR